MAKIHTLKVSNYRGIKHFNQVFGITDFVCIIGRGDSGKTSILEAIAAVLSPNWNLSFYDTDFYNANIENAIEIEVSLYDIPVKLLQESKFGLYVRGLNTLTNTIDDNINDSDEIILTIKLVVEKDLEPKWYVVNERDNQEAIEIRASERASLNVFLISDYIDRHFSWSKGTPLYSLLRQDELVYEKTDVVINAFRQAKEKIDSHSFSYLDNVIKKINDTITSLGVETTDTNTTIDFKDITFRDSRVCLHESKIPFRMKGKGSKRLISIAIQLELAKEGGIILIDEIEQGLEPDRVKHLVRTFQENKTGQIFITTHSRDVLVELDAKSLFLLKKASSEMYQFGDSFQGCLRANPEAFFAKRILVCEGATEIGICRAIDNFRSENQSPGNIISAISLVDGTGSNFINYCKQFKEAGFDVCAFCDSDDSAINEKKKELKLLGITLIDCEADNAIEQQLFLDLPWNGVMSLFTYACEDRGTDSIHAFIKNQDSTFNFENWQNVDTPEHRNVLGKVAGSKGWFKRIDHGEFIGGIWCKNLQTLQKEKKLYQQFTELSNWMDNA